MRDPNSIVAGLNNVYEATEAYACQMDANDSLSSFRDYFLIPKTSKQQDCIYLAGNSLGLQPKSTKKYIEQELEDWAHLGVEGHFKARSPWLPYHENLTEMTARLVGAKPLEVVVMNSLTVNLHLMLVSFYRPSRKRYKILIEANAFPSDQYAVASHANYHGFDPTKAICELSPRTGELTLRTEDVVAFLENEGEQIALVMLGNVNYLTGQAFDMSKITKAAQSKGCVVGFNLAHGAGNLDLHLNEDNVDFAVWCSYKYLNAGPGAIAGCFVHERHAYDFDLPRFAGWWGHNKRTRFQMGSVFDPIPGVEGWQLSNPPIFQLAALRASMEIFDAATMSKLRQKSILLTGYLKYLLELLPNKFCQVITPDNANERGCQLSFRVNCDPSSLLNKLKAEGVFCDFREPDVLRCAPVPLYNSFSDVLGFARLLEKYAK